MNKVKVGDCRVFTLTFEDGKKLETKCKIIRRRKDTGEVLALILTSMELYYFDAINF